MSDFPTTEFVALKASYTQRISKELLDDAVLVDRAFRIGLGLEKPTAKEIAAEKRYAAKQARLRAAGLIDDAGYPKKVTECPVRIPLGNYDSTEDARCERKVGHGGPHKCSIEWEPWDAS